MPPEERDSAPEIEGNTIPQQHVFAAAESSSEPNSFFKTSGTKIGDFGASAGQGTSSAQIASI
jgi:hypothetical protein